MRPKNFYDDVFMRAIEGRSVNRLGICPICDKLFVAFRYDQRTCSARCGNVLRVRESRSPETVSRNPTQAAPGQPKREPEDPDELFSCPECGAHVKRIDTRHDARGRRLCKKCFDSWFSEAEREAERIRRQQKNGLPRPDREEGSDERLQTRKRLVVQVQVQRAGYPRLGEDER